jgi:hypothetical protein
MKVNGGVEIKLPAFLNSALDVGELSASCPSRFTPGEVTFVFVLDRRLGGRGATEPV